MATFSQKYDIPVEELDQTADDDDEIVPDRL